MTVRLDYWNGEKWIPIKGVRNFKITLGPTAPTPPTPTPALVQPRPRVKFPPTRHLPLCPQCAAPAMTWNQHIGLPAHYLEPCGHFVRIIRHSYGSDDIAFLPPESHLLNHVATDGYWLSIAEERLKMIRGG